jgi:hypothetical protein
VHSVKEQLFNYIVLCFIKLQILARISSFSLLRSQYNFCSGLRTWKFWQILLTLLNISVLISGHVEHDIRKCFSDHLPHKTDIQKVNYVTTANSKQTLDLHNIDVYWNPLSRGEILRIRISSHRLQIERGRYQSTLRQERYCLRCTSGKIDDEKKILISCSTCSWNKNRNVQQDQ